MTDPSHKPALWSSDLHPALQGSEFFYMSGEDSLRVAAYNTASGVTLTIVGRFLSLAGEVQPFVQSYIPTTGGAQSLLDCKLGDGWLMNVAVYASVGTPTSTQCLVALRVIRGLLGATQELATIAQGYVTATNRLPYPGQPVATTATTTSGTLRQLVGTTPAAGADYSDAVQASVVWEILMVHLTLTTSATVANRRPKFAVCDSGGNVLWFNGYAGDVTASQTREFCWAAGVPNNLIDTGLAALALPNRLFLPASSFLKTITTGLQAGDQWSLPKTTVIETAA